MRVTTLGDLAQNALLQRSMAELKRTALTAGTEVATGRSGDIAQKLGGNLAPLAAIEGSLSRLEGYRSATRQAALTSSAMQTALEVIDAQTEEVAVSLISAGTLEDAVQVDALTRDAGARLDSVIAALNTRAGDRSLFAGIATDGPAVAASDVILGALETAVAAAGATTADQIASAVATWFADPAGYATIGYLGGDPLSPLPLSAEDKADLSFTAEDPALRATLEALSLAALVDRGTVASTPQVRADLARASGERLLQVRSDRVALAGRIGLAEGRIEQASVRNEAEKTTLQQALADLVRVDPYEAATRMENAQTQLESIYAVTARLSRLSLVDYLR